MLSSTEHRHQTAGHRSPACNDQDFWETGVPRRKPMKIKKNLVAATAAVLAAGMALAG